MKVWCKWGVSTVCQYRQASANSAFAPTKQGGKMAQVELTVAALPEIAISEQRAAGTVFG
ncbi:hypothetical protein ACTMTJ_28405 [Phytohabitans sp. LJ34]|uniref:hypothetical protein n=1 Tax=Phytohabitans sp. LJ34 TaxID=3452217 RepID=UPI003F88E0F4